MSVEAEYSQIMLFLDRLDLRDTFPIHAVVHSLGDRSFAKTV